MAFINSRHSLCAFLMGICLTLSLYPYPAWGDDGEETLNLFNAWQGEPATASRAPKPLSRTAENVTVVTARDIEAINAHTLADVLATIPGIQTDQRGGPGGVTFTTIQSSNFNHVLVLLDGVPLNSDGNFSDVALVPARVIERIEIIKGPAPASWGQALGGVISVTTKTPDRERTITGSVDSSIGERTTADIGVTLSGTSGSLGYFLSGGYLGSNGLLPFHSIFSRNLFGKLTWDLPGKGQIRSAVGYSLANNRGDLFAPLIDFKEREDNEKLTVSLGVQKPLSDKLELELTGRFLLEEVDLFGSQISDNSPFDPSHFRDRVYGTGAKLIWREANNLLVLGSEYEHTEAKNNLGFATGQNFVKINRWGAYLNDTIDLGRFSIIPGARFDRVGAKDQFSPSLGMVWRLTDKSLLRGYTGQGYGIRAVNNNNVERIWTSQVGFESSALPYLWLKGTLFRNQTWNIQVFDTNTGTLAAERRIALGGEIEARTTPVWNTSLGGGWTYTETTRTGSGTQVFGAPRHTVQLALRYDDNTYHGTLTGRHIYWNSDPAFNGKYRGLAWDLHLGAMLLKRENNSLELFFSGHNLFNTNQFQDELIPSTGRWFEGGMRVRF